MHISGSAGFIGIVATDRLALLAKQLQYAYSWNEDWANDGQENDNVASGRCKANCAPEPSPHI